MDYIDALARQNHNTKQELLEHAETIENSDLLEVCEQYDNNRLSKTQS